MVVVLVLVVVVVVVVGGGGVFLLEVQYSVLKSLISTCVLSYVGSRKERIGYLTESASLKRTAGIV